MYYLKIRDTETGGNSLVYYCRNCGHEDTTLTAESVCVSETQLRRSEQKYSHIVNEFTKFDPTLPRINTIKCPNQECSSNNAAGQSGGGRKNTEESGKAAAESGKAAAESGKAAEPSKKKIPLKIKTKKNESAAQATAAQSQAEAEINEILAEEDKEAAEELAEQKREQAKELAKEQSSNENENENGREVIYIRYDDINMKYVYLCVHCDTTWKTDNR